MKQQRWAIVISQNGLTDGDSHSEIYQLLTMLEKAKNPPVKLYFTTEGVSLVATGSPVLARLKQLEASGVEMVACRTCLDYMGLRDHVEVGHIGAMEHMVAEMEGNSNVVLL